VSPQKNSDKNLISEKKEFLVGFVDPLGEELPLKTALVRFSVICALEVSFNRMCYINLRFTYFYLWKYIDVMFALLVKGCCIQAKLHVICWS